MSLQCLSEGFSGLPEHHAPFLARKDLQFDTVPIKT